jgi:hypothetical protein
MVRQDPLPTLLRRLLEECKERRSRSYDELASEYASRPPAIRELAAALHFHVRSDHERALRHAGIALSMASGSRWLNALPYFLNHPDGFEAPLPPSIGGSELADQGLGTGIDPRLVDGWIDGMAGRSAPVAAHAQTESEPVEEASLELDDIATETLARILQEQGRLEESDRMLARLKSRRTP